MNKEMEPFWLVWNPRGRSPMYRHGNLQLAQDEAERLARNNPGEEFYVVVTVGRGKAVNVVWEQASEIPF